MSRRRLGPAGGAAVAVLLVGLSVGTSTASAQSSPAPSSDASVLPACLAIGSDSLAWTRTDGATGAGDDVRPASLAVADDGISVMVGRRHSFERPEPVIASSRDGSTWEVATLPATVEGQAVYEALAAGPHGFLAAGGGSRGSLLRSIDGTTWEDVTPSSITVAFVGLADVVAGPGGYVVVGNEQLDGGNGDQVPMAWRSTDLVEWVPARLPGKTGLAWVVAADPESGRFVASGLADQRVAVWTSDDGVTWERGNARGLKGFAQDLAYGAGRFYLLVHDTAKDPDKRTSQLWSSDDGARWRRVKGVDGFVTNLGSVGQRLVAAGPGAVWLSRDGRRWETLEDASFSPAARFQFWAEPDELSVQAIVGGCDGRILILGTRGGEEDVTDSVVLIGEPGSPQTP